MVCRVVVFVEAFAFNKCAWLVLTNENAPVPLMFFWCHYSVLVQIVF